MYRHALLQLLGSARNPLAYTNTIKALGPIAYWPQAEPSGTTIVDESGNGRNGTYVGVTLGQPGIGDGRTAAGYVSSVGNIYSASLAGAFNGQDVCATIWFQPANAGIWTDGIIRRLASWRVDASNMLLMSKDSAANTLTINYIAGGVSKAVTFTLSATDWTHIAVRVRKSSDKLEGYLNGVKSSVLQSGIGTWAGSLAPTLTCLGAGNSGGGNSWIGSLAHAGVFGSAMTTADGAVCAQANGHITFEGDSRTSFAMTAAVMADSAVVARRFGYDNVATPGASVATMITEGSTQVDPLFRSTLGLNMASIWGSLNDAPSTPNATTLHGRLATWCAARRAAGIRTGICTEIDCQSAALNAVNWHSTIYPTLNTLIRANWSSYADFLVDLGADARLQNALDTTYFNVDATHLTAAGIAVVAGIYAAAIAAP